MSDSNEMSQWEVVTEHRENRVLPVVDKTERLKVPGGWLYRTVITFASRNKSVAMVFVPEVK